MEITLQERTADYVRIYFERTQDDQIDRMLPRSVNSLDQALENFAQTKETPNAMLSYCIFEKSCWGKGIASRALSLFLNEIAEKYALSSVGAFTFADNIASIRVLEKNGFSVKESFVEDGRESVYLEYRVQDRG